MKKNKLIEILQQIEGNPDVTIWNGYAEDYQNISKVEKVELYGMSLKEKFRFINLERKFDGIPPLKSINDLQNKKVDWDFQPAEYMDIKRTVILIEPKLRNETSYGRDSGSDLKY